MSFVKVLTPDQWCSRYGVTISNPDGWRTPGSPSWDEPITLREFHRRAGASTKDVVNPNWQQVDRDAAEEVSGTSDDDQPKFGEQFPTLPINDFHIVNSATHTFPVATNANVVTMAKYYLMNHSLDQVTPSLLRRILSDDTVISVLTDALAEARAAVEALRRSAADEHGRLSQDLDNAEEAARLRAELTELHRTIEDGYAKLRGLATSGVSYAPNIDTYPAGFSRGRRGAFEYAANLVDTWRSPQPVRLGGYRIHTRTEWDIEQSTLVKIIVKHMPCDTIIFGDQETDSNDFDAATLLSIIGEHRCQDREDGDRG